MSAVDNQLGAGEWKVVNRVRNPWGQVPLTGGGRSLPSRSKEYMDRLVAVTQAKDTVSRRHHYVPRTYLKHWSFDGGKRVWALDTNNGAVKPLGIASICVQEDFYRVNGLDGVPHNRVELMFGVVDSELRRIQNLLNRLEDPDELEFDDLIGLGVTVAVQRMRTAQQRRLRNQHNEWLVAQNADDFKPLEDLSDPLRAAGIHTQLLFETMWEAADVMTTRQIEIWEDPQGRFMTSDAPVIFPFKRNRRSGLMAAPYILWPISPHRTLALARDSLGEKAVIQTATGKQVGMVKDGVLQGRERMVFLSEDQIGRLPKSKKFPRRPQVRLRCSQRSPSGEYIDPPGCCVEAHEAFASAPDVHLCAQGLHRPAPGMSKYA